MRDPEPWEVGVWTDRQLLLFAADCWERVLPPLENSSLDRQAQQRAIGVLRAYARGDMTPNEFDDAVVSLAPQVHVAGMWPDDSDAPIDADACAKFTAAEAVRRVGWPAGWQADRAVWAAAGFATRDQRWEATLRVKRAERIVRIAKMSPERAVQRDARIASEHARFVTHVRELRAEGEAAEAERFATTVAENEATEAEDMRLAAAYSEWLRARGDGLSSGESPIAEYDEVVALDRLARNASRRAERPVRKAEREWQRRRFAEIVASTR